MNKTIDATQKQILRGRVLSICNELQSTGAGIPLLHMVLKKESQACSQGDIVETCSYLQDKGLINVKYIHSDALNAERNIAYITAKGIDVLEGTTPIEGIILV